jgi:hypothetical protein
MDELQKNALIRMAHDLSRGDTRIVAAARAAVEKPPRTTEEVGFYVSGDENDLENCFRMICGLIEESHWGSSAEDKYCAEIFEQWVGEGRLEELPAEAQHAFENLEELHPHSLEDTDALRSELRAHFTAAVESIERAFEAIGQPLLSLDTGGGDTLFFVNVEPHVADKWRDVELGKSHDGDSLAIRSPMWPVLWEYLGYCTGDDLGEVPAGVAPLRPLQPLDEAMKRQGSVGEGSR